MKSIKIIGTGSFLPNKIVTNRDLFKKISNFEYDRAKLSLSKKGIDVTNLKEEDVFDYWVQQVSGIEERRYVTDELINDPIGANERMAYYASVEAIKDAGINKDDIDTVLFTSFTPNRLIPNASITLSHELELSNTHGFIMNTACSGFLDALSVASAKLLSGQSKVVLIAASEYLTNTLDYGDPTTAILFGDGAGAAIVTVEDGEDENFSFDSIQDYSPEHICMKNGEILKMGGGPNVQKMAVNSMSMVLNNALNKLNKNTEDIDVLIPHQANLRIIKQLGKKLKLDENKIVVTIPKIGNISCATIPVSLDLFRKGKTEYKYVKGETTIGFTAVGGGYTYTSVITKL